ncbi:MAG: hypothetical protein IJB27_06455 [Clostridia bacterium]|nr:hypothetical protein [Clostridia bacterium]
MLKRVLGILLVGFMLCAFAACGDSSETPLDSLVNGDSVSEEAEGVEDSNLPKEESIVIRDHNKTMAAANEALYYVKADGTLWGMGRVVDFYTETNPRPQQEKGNQSLATYIMGGVKAIDANSSLLYILKEDDSLWCLGWQTQYEHLESSAEYNDFVKLAEDVASFSVDDDKYLIVKNDGSVWGAGKNYYGIICWDDKETDSFGELQLIFEEGAAAVSVGNNAGYVLKQDGTVWGWGTNFNHSIKEGWDPYRYIREQPTKIMDDVVFIEATERGGCFAIQKDETLWVWGDQWGEIYEPTQIMENVAHIASDYWWDFAVKTDGSVYGWGSKLGGGMFEENPYGVLSEAELNPYYNGDRIHESTPVPLAINEVVEMTVSGNNAFFLRSDGTLYGSGDRFVFGSLRDDEDAVGVFAENTLFYGPLTTDMKVE